jgi:hypothetical protein
MSDVSSAEVSAAADSVCSSSVDGYTGPAGASTTDQQTQDQQDQQTQDQATAQAQQEAGICIGTEDECDKQFAEEAQRKADAMTDEEAIKALDGVHLHNPTEITPAQVKGLEALTRADHLDQRTKDQIRSFLEDHYNGYDRLGFGIGALNAEPIHTPPAPSFPAPQ